jgi:hypothetical protein
MSSVNIYWVSATHTVSTNVFSARENIIKPVTSTNAVMQKEIPSKYQDAIPVPRKAFR